MRPIICAFVRACFKEMRACFKEMQNNKYEIIVTPSKMQRHQRTNTQINGFVNPLRKKVWCCNAGEVYYYYIIIKLPLYVIIHYNGTTKQLLSKFIIIIVYYLD
jgi:hypothetical protein